MTDKLLPFKVRLLVVITDLKAPKNQFNKFGNYSYRSAEDIIEAVKPLLAENSLLMSISDMVTYVGERHYVMGIVRVTDVFSDEYQEVSALAREAYDQKGMGDAQITGSASSYARKYALNGMFLIDDTKDDDATNDHGKAKEIKPEPIKEVTTPITPEQVGKLLNAAKMKGYNTKQTATQAVEALSESIFEKKFENLNSGQAEKLITDISSPRTTKDLLDMLLTADIPF